MTASAAGRYAMALALWVPLLIWSGSVSAQQAEAIPRVGYVGFQTEPEPSRYRIAFIQGLSDRGYILDQNIRLEIHRWSNEAQLRQALRALAKAQVDAIFVGPPSAAKTATQVAPAIPTICASCGDPVENGLARSLARPGGSVSGIASLSAELIGKRIQLLKELLPHASKVAVFMFPSNPGAPATLQALEGAGTRLNIEIYRLDIRTPQDLDTAFLAAAKGNAGAIILQDDPSLRATRTKIAELQFRHRIPVFSGLSEIVDSGGLMSYGPDRVEMSRHAAELVAKVLKGATVSDLPFEQVSKLELIVNLRSAKALDLSIPQSLLLRADRVIE